MATQYQRNIQVGLTLEAEIKPVRNGRVYLLIQNLSVGAIYINFDTHADASNGIQIPSGGVYEREINVPDNYIYVIGDQSGNNQNITVSEAYV